jgi:hypothetical protein
MQARGGDRPHGADESGGRTREDVSNGAINGRLAMSTTDQFVDVYMCYREFCKI